MSHFFLHPPQGFYLNFFFENFMHVGQIHTVPRICLPSDPPSPHPPLASYSTPPPSSGLAGNVHILHRLLILCSPDEVLWETPRHNDWTSSNNFLGSSGEKWCLCFPWHGRMIDEPTLAGYFKDDKCQQLPGLLLPHSQSWARVSIGLWMACLSSYTFYLLTESNPCQA